ncbi:hypothetical protein K0U00_12090, partial [Paenibacillus sepulcri]|nr:hypothetical protein [Paenibacillus sepulcri]
MIALQAAGYRAYARLLELEGRLEESAAYAGKAGELEQRYDQEWWNADKGRFFGAMLQNRTFLEAYNAEGNFLPLYFGVIKDKSKLEKALEDLKRNRVANVEGKTYLPDVFYRYGLNEEALQELKELVDPSLERRDYPEVSYCVVGSMASGLMGISADGQSAITTMSRLSSGLEWAELGSIPILNRTLTVRHNGIEETTVTLQEGEPLLWKAVFHTNSGTMLHNGSPVQAATERSDGGDEYRYLMIQVAEGETHRVSLG